MVMSIYDGMRYEVFWRHLDANNVFVLRIIMRIKLSEHIMFYVYKHATNPHIYLHINRMKILRFSEETFVLISQGIPIVFNNVFAVNIIRNIIFAEISHLSKTDNSRRLEIVFLCETLLNS
jgi:hypothetical protein